MMTRQSGFYWVKQRKGLAWEVGFFFKSETAWRIGSAPEARTPDSKIYQINETRIPEPDEVSDA